MWGGRRGGLVWGRCRLGRWGWLDCVRSQSRPSSTHLRKGHSEWRRLGGTFRGLAGPRYSLYVRVTGKVSRRFRSSVVVSHGLPLYPSVVRGDLLRGIGQSVPDAARRHRAPNPFAGGFTNRREILLQIPVIACPCVSANMPLCKLAGACAGTRQAVSPATYAVERFAVRQARADFGWGGRVSARRRMPPLCVPYAAEGPSAHRIWRRSAPEARRVPTGHLASQHGSSRREKTGLPVAHPCH